MNKHHNEHYICTGGCRGVSDKPGICQAVDCPHHGKPLEKCDCQDEDHYGKQEAGSEEKEGSD